MDWKAVETLCMGCLSQMKEGERFCTQCGFDNETPKEPHHLPPKSILAGKYLMGKVLGEGGFGITYLGFDLNLNIKVAIKEYFPSGFVARAGSGSTVTPFTGASTEYYHNGIEKFLAEARSLARFHNLDGIVEVRDFFRENGTAYIVMEFVDGVNLRDELERRGGRMPAREVTALMQPLVESLVKVHRTGLVHRDISPDNIMLTAEGKLKLLDFGAARDASASKSVSVVLKPGYAPEEQYRTHGELGAWTDIYALCGTIYKLITGVTPPESIERLCSDTLKTPSALGISMNPAQESALLRGLSVRREGRFNATDELYEALYGDAAKRAEPAQQTVAAAYTQPLSGVYTPMQTAQPQEGGFKKLWAEKKGLLIAGAGGVALLAVLLVVLLTGNGKEPTGGPLVGTPTVAPTSGVTLPPASATPALATPAQAEEPAAGALTFIDPGVFFEQAPEIATVGANTEYSYLNMDWHALINYLTVLQHEGYDVEVFGDGDVLFTVSEGGTTITFRVGDDDASIIMVCPSTVTLDLSGSPVTEPYLENNGLTADQWIELGATSTYSYSGYNYMGNTNFNLQNNSEVALQGDVIYVADNNDGTGLYAVDATTGDVTKQLVEDTRFLRDLNVVGNYLYYCAVESDGSNNTYTLCRVRTNGSSTSPEELIEGAKTALVYGDYVYFLYTDGSYWRMHTTTLDTELVLENGGYRQNIAGGRIYALDAGGTTGIYSYALDGTDETYLFDADCYQMAVSGGWIYYLTSASGSELRRVDIDGDNDQSVVSDSVLYFLVVADRVYYTLSGSNELKSFSLLTGDTRSLISSGRYPAAVETENDIWLFYTDADGYLCSYDFEGGKGIVVSVS